MLSRTILDAGGGVPNELWDRAPPNADVARSPVVPSQVRLIRTRYDQPPEPNSDARRGPLSGVDLNVALDRRRDRRVLRCSGLGVVEERRSSRVPDLDAEGVRYAAAVDGR